jgi:hypothetical protein
MLFLYENHSASRRKLSAHGVIGKFHSVERYYCYDNAYNVYVDDPEASVIVIRLELSNKGIIDLPVEEMVYFGSWSKKNIGFIGSRASFNFIFDLWRIYLCAIVDYWILVRD